MKLLLTSSGIANASIHDALVELLGKPVAEASALFVPIAMHPFPNSAGWVWRTLCGKTESSFAQLGWKSMGVLELTSLPSIDKNIWVPMVEETDALLVGGGDPLYLSHWMKESGLADLLPSMQQVVYVGVSAGSMAVAGTFAETYSAPRGGSGTPLTSEEILFSTPEGDVSRTFITAQGVGLTDFALIPHLDHKHHPDASLPHAERWAGKLSVPVYAIDDQTAIKVIDDTVDVVSEGHWKLFNA